MDRRELGDIGEAMASAFLLERGYEVIGKQVRVGRGEIDLVAKEGDEIVFVEVKTRRSAAYGSPEESVTEAKLAQLYRLAQMYVGARGYAGPWRIDVIAISLGSEDPIYHIRGVS